MTREAQTTHDKTINVWLMFESIFQVEKRREKKIQTTNRKSIVLLLFPPSSRSSFDVYINRHIGDNS